MPVDRVALLIILLFVADLVESEDEYIIALKERPGNKNSQRQYAKVIANNVKNELGLAMRTASFHKINFALIEAPEKIINQLKRRPWVKYIEQNKVVSLDCLQQDVTDENLWGLDRIDQQQGTDDQYVCGDDDDGSGVRVYVVDTGVNIDLAEFEGRASYGFNGYPNEAPGDGHGHGTHVAGTIASKTYGVAKKANIVAVKVMDSTGSSSNFGIIQGFQWIEEQNYTGKSVINLSIGGSYSQSLNDALQSLIDDCIPAVAAAGNHAIDACQVSPASLPAAITVGATNSNDELADFSNTGDCVDISAPGEDIKSLALDGTTVYLSGTSMATSHVTGAVARFLTSNNDACPAEVAQWVLSTATNGVLSFPYHFTLSTPNRLLYIPCV